MFASYISSEFKKWLRDPMMAFMVVYPVFFGVVGRYLVPWIYETNNLDINAHVDIILAALSLLAPMIFGAVIGFSILDDRDDHILTSIRVTPLTIHQFLSFKLGMALVFGLLATFFVLWFSDLGGLTIGQILPIAFLAGTGSPMTGLLINAFSKNKIEGFAVMKGFGTLIAFPVIALFFFDIKELIFAIAPGFWPAKAVSAIIRGDEIMYLSFNLYYALGLVYTAVMNLLAYKLFMRKIQT